MAEVPKEALYIGLAGVIPYMATSLSTVYLAYDINHADVHGSGLLMDPATAEILLHIIEPLQIGYGAVVSKRHLSAPELPNTTRSSPSWAPSIGVSSGPSMEAITATAVTRTELSHQPSRGPLHSFPSKVH